MKNMDSDQGRLADIEKRIVDLEWRLRIAELHKILDVRLDELEQRLGRIENEMGNVGSQGKS